MAQVPTSICHLLNAADQPLVTCLVRNAQGNKIRRLRVTAQVEGFSAPAVETVELEALKNHELNLLPTFFPDKISQVRELTRATLTVQVDDLDRKIELHRTHPIWLLARTSAPLAVTDPQTGKRVDLTRYFGAFVTPKAPSIMTFLRTAAAQHPTQRLVGYQIGEQEVQLEVKAIFEALKSSAGIVYVNSLIDFNPDAGAASQRVRLPRESLADKEANCIDGTVLFASLLEAASLSPAICLVPGHAFLAWETWQDNGKWRYLETTMVGTHTFEEACASAEATAEANGALMTLWPVRALRATHGIMPME